MSIKLPSNTHALPAAVVKAKRLVDAGAVWRHKSTCTQIHRRTASYVCSHELRPPVRSKLFLWITFRNSI